MSEITDRIATHLVQPLGWALVHSIWQLACLAAVLAVAMRLLGQRSANVRYALCGVILCSMVALPAATYILYLPSVDTAIDSKSTTKGVVLPLAEQGSVLERRIDSDPTTAVPLTADIPRSESGVWNTRNAKSGFALKPLIQPTFPWIVTAWMVGVFFRSVWNLGGWIAVQRMARLGTRPVSHTVREKLAELGERLGGTRCVQVVESVIVQAPCVIGWLRPVILLPLGIVSGLSPSQLEAVLAHELAHVRRLDYLANLLQTVVETLLFYHPAAWYVSRRMRMEREYCADQLAAEILGDSIAYARALAAATEHIQSAPQFALAASGGSLMNRVRRLFGLETRDGGRTGSWLLGATGSLVMLVSLVVAPPLHSALSLSSAPRVTMRRVWADTATDYTGRISPDGRYIAFTTWNNGNNLAVHELESGENRELTKGGGWNPPPTYAESPLWSPDSRQVAYAWFVGKKQDLRVVAVDGGEPRIVVEGQKDVNWAYPRDWTPDGKKILAQVKVGEDRPYHALIDVADGSLHRLPDSLHAWDTASISPDGKHVAFDRRGEAKEYDIYLFDIATGKSNPIVSHPADDRFPLWSFDGKWLTFVSTRSGKREPWMLPFVDGRARGQARKLAQGLEVTQPMGLTARGVYSAGLMARQYNIHQVSYDPDSNTASSTPNLLVQRFEGGNSRPTWSSDGTKLAFISLRPIPGGGSQRIVVVRDEATGKEVYPPIGDPFHPKRAHLAWRRDNKTLLIRMLGRRQDSENSHKQRLLAWDLDTGRVTTLVEWPIRATAPRISYAFAVSPDDAFLYYAALEEKNTVRIVRRRLIDGQERDMATILDADFAQSLALSPDGSRLAIRDSSTIRFVDLSSGEHEVVYRTGSTQSIGSSMAWTAAGDYLLFAQRADGDQPPTRLMRIPASGGDPQPVGLSMARIGHLAMHPTGRQLAFDGSRSPHAREVWFVENSLLMRKD